MCEDSVFCVHARKEIESFSLLTTKLLMILIKFFPGITVCLLFSLR